jgi:hypothetical protein
MNRTTIRINQRRLEQFRRTLPCYRQKEIFLCPGKTFDIVEAQYLVAKKPHELLQLQTREIAIICGYNNTPIKEEDGYAHFAALHGGKTIISVNAAMASEDIDTSRPIIIVPASFYVSMIIDGLHRVYKAFVSGDQERR